MTVPPDTRPEPSGVAALLAKLDPAAEGAMRAMIGGALRTQAVYVAAKLGIADHLSLGARTVEDLARLVDADALMLRRVLRFLAFQGVFVEHEDGRFALNALAESLQTGHPRSLRPSAIRAGEGLWDVTSRLMSAVQSGVTPYEQVHGTSFFERLTDRGKEAEFASRMSGSVSGLADRLAALDAISSARRIVDVGGGHGALLAQLLRAHPHLRGVLFDREATIAGAQAVLDRAGVRDRCETVSGDFFEAVPEGGDVYLLSWILHDWDDARATRILQACRAAGTESATLAIVEVLLPDRAQPASGAATGVIADPYTLDLQMLLLTGGRERTAGEYCELLRIAGYELTKIAESTGSARGASILEARVSPGRG
jgi:predicted O-methyltransferase YrrM